MALWDQPGVPHKGWVWKDSYDAFDDGDYVTCEMCGQERVRYVHIMEHESYFEELKVGCVCAEKMSDDYINPRGREKDLQKRAGRRKNWIKRSWKESTKGNPKIKAKGYDVVIFPDKVGRYGIGAFKDGQKHFASKKFLTVDAAKQAAFNFVEELSIA